MFRFRPFGVILSLIFLLLACTKIDTTKLGAGLIPAVDNVNTFDTLIDIATNNYLFDDSTRLSKTEFHTVGSITGDPLFGSTKAAMYLEMMPNVFPYSFYSGDSITKLDSVVLSLSYKGAYGDTLSPVEFRVYRLNEAMKADIVSDFPATYKFSQTFTAGAELGRKFFPGVNKLRDSVTISYRDSLKYRTANQVRIKLDATQFGNIFNTDTLLPKNDTLFRTLFKGLKVEANMMNTPGALVYFSLSDTATKMEFFYRKRNGTARPDTLVGTFYCGGNAGHANNIVRDRAGSQLQNHLATTSNGDSLLYIYTNPGTYARLRLKGLENVPNMIVHRAEIKMTQILDNTVLDAKLTPPNFLYLDRFDTAVDRVKFQPIPFDLNAAAAYSTCFPSTEGIDYSYFGGTPVTRLLNGQIGYEYTFNLSRYVQSIVTRHARISELRLSSSMFAEYFDCYGVQYIPVTGNRVAEGRVRLGGGTHSRYKMQLRIIYSKL